ncbi:ABC transporter ATP-binding protein [Hugenholtzia roseola]|uniref:ABC transporter ATP-binding protein n=1 Tax=Hugenholtzia roseola TaxID=1002 RepID=UPI0004055E35|nr:ATP-binding cassette domain-containing protein [Hugenholtzia roseola]
MIEVRNIKKAFNGKAVLKGIDAQFQKGQTNLIIGGSGTGKSVLLKCIVGLIEPDEGAVEFDKRDFLNARVDTKRDIRQEIGMLFQGSALFDSMTVAENVRFPLDMRSKMSLEEKMERVNFCLKRVGLEQSANKMPSEVSGGQKKRVGIARAIVMNPQYLFCDEPNSGLDPQTSTVIDNLIKEITEEYQMTTIVVTHDMNSVMEIGEYVIFLHQGYKVWEGTKNNIVNSSVSELNEFLFSNNLMRSYKAYKNSHDRFLPD